MAYGSVNVPGRLTAADVNALPLSGGTMSGPLSVLDPTDPQHAVNKAYVDSIGNQIAQIIFESQNTGVQPRVYNVTLEPRGFGASLYKFEFSLTLGSSGWASVRLVPPAGYAFTIVSTAGPYPIIQYDYTGYNKPETVPTPDSNGAFKWTLPANATIQNIKFAVNDSYKPQYEYALVYMEVA